MNEFWFFKPRYCYHFGCKNPVKYREPIKGKHVYVCLEHRRQETVENWFKKVLKQCDCDGQIDCDKCVKKVLKHEL
jgi:hypothetical protein